MLEVYMFPCLADNYGFLLHDNENNLTAAIDTPDAKKINEMLAFKKWKLTHILNTHHHFDHSGGNEELKLKWNCHIVGALKDVHRIHGVDFAVSDNQVFDFGNHQIKVLEVPGHTSGHIAFYISSAKIAFVGDTVFSLGCGRLFEGTASELFESISKLSQLPDETLFYCGHEYTASNAKFALSVDPNNCLLMEYAEKITRLRSENLPTIPTTLAHEKMVNPFLRANDENLKKVLGMEYCSSVEVLAELRSRKDEF